MCCCLTHRMFRPIQRKWVRRMFHSLGIGLNSEFRSIEAAWAGGLFGRQVIDRVLPKVGVVLTIVKFEIS